MKARKINMISWMILLSSLPSLAADNALAPPYMGQEPPGLTPKVFAPGLLSIPNRIENDICLSQDGRECYFTSRTAGWTVYEIMVTRYENGQWTTPVRASFSNSRSLGPAWRTTTRPCTSAAARTSGGPAGRPRAGPSRRSCLPRSARRKPTTGFHLHPRQPVDLLVAHRGPRGMRRVAGLLCRRAVPGGHESPHPQCLGQ